MPSKIHKKYLFLILFLLFLPRNIFSSEKPHVKYFISIKESAVKIKPDDKSKTIAKLCKDVYAKSLGFEDEWLFVDIEYNNLLADSLDDINIHFNGWVNKNDFKEVLKDSSKAELDTNLPCFENITYFLQNNIEALAELWQENEKFFLFYKKDKVEFFKLPNTVYDNKNIISGQTPFVIISKCRDWNGLNWLEIVYDNPDSSFQNGWIKKVEIVNEKDKNLQEGINKKIEEIKKEKEIEIKKLKDEINKLMETINTKMQDTSIITGKNDFDKRIRELEIQKLNNESEEKLERLNIIQSPF